MPAMNIVGHLLCQLTLIPDDFLYAISIKRLPFTDKSTLEYGWVADHRPITNHLHESVDGDAQKASGN